MAKDLFGTIPKKPKEKVERKKKLKKAPRPMKENPYSSIVQESIRYIFTEHLKWESICFTGLLAACADHNIPEEFIIQKIEEYRNLKGNYSLSYLKSMILNDWWEKGKPAPEPEVWEEPVKTEYTGGKGGNDLLGNPEDISSW